MKYRMLREESGYFRVLYRSRRNVTYALVDDGGCGRRNLNWYLCSPDGEPQDERPMPPAYDFIDYVEP